MKKMFKKSKILVVYLFAMLLGLSTSVMAATTAVPAGGSELESTLKVANSTVGTGYEKSVTAKVDDVVKYEIYYHNNENEASGKNIDNLNIKVALPTAKSTSHVANLTIGGSNSNTITDSAIVTTSIPSTIQFIPGTVFRRYNTGTNTNPVWVTDNISNAVVTTSGFTIPSMKPCYNYLETIVFQARVMAPVVSITKQVKIEGSSTWSTNITAKPGDTLAYLITFKNEGNVTLNNLIVRDNLPAGLTYVNGSTKITNTLYPNGVKGTDDVTKGGIIIGNYLPGANGYVRFNATVPATITECGRRTYTNVGVVKANELGEFYNTAIVNVEYPCTPVTPPVTPPVVPPVVIIGKGNPLPTSGPAEAAAGAAGLTTIGGASYAWLRSKKALLSAVSKIK
jgi:uncharacterized repeat protein (TIGR01451 family)